MKNKLRMISLLSAVVLMLGGCGKTATAQTAGTALKTDTYFENGIIYTADRNNTIVEALAVSDGVITFAGTAKEGESYKKAAAEVIDLQGKMLMPGLIDGHLHSVSPDFFDFSLLGILSADETLKTIKACVDANPAQETFYGFGFMATLFDDEEISKGPRKERLDEICPDKPMIILSYDGHSVWLNSKALEYCHVTKETECVPGGVIVKDDNGELWGTLQDAAVSYTSEFPLNQEKVTVALKEFLQTLNSMGYTTIMSPPANGFFPIPWEAYKKLEDENQLSVRVRAASIITSWHMDKDLATVKELKEKYGNGDLLKLYGTKFFLDGVVDNKSAYLLEPYTNDPTYRGEAGWEPEALKEAVKAVNELDMPVHLHAMGDAATRMGLDAIEYSQDKLGRDDFRNAMTHLQIIEPADMKRFGELKIVAVANPYWHYKGPQFWDVIEYAFIGERAETEYPLKTFLDNNVTLVFASDYPVTSVPNPFVSIQTGVTRNLVDGTEYGVPDITNMDDPTYLLSAEERLTVEQMIQGYTRDAAYAVFEEDNTGSLEVGKAADLIIIDQNILTIEPLKMKETKVLRTYLKGQLVFNAEE